MHGALIHLTGATDLAFTSVPGTDPPVFRQGFRQTRRPARPSGRGPDHRQGPPTVAALAHVLRRDRALHSGRPSKAEGLPRNPTYCYWYTSLGRRTAWSVAAVTTLGRSLRGRRPQCIGLRSWPSRLPPSNRALGIVRLGYDPPRLCLGITSK